MQIWLTILVSWPAPDRTHQRHGARVVLRARARRLREHRVVAADHDRQLAVLGAGLPARDRRVEEGDAASLARRRSLRARLPPKRSCDRRGSRPSSSRRARRPAVATARTSSSLPTHISTMSALRAASAGVGADCAAVLRDPLLGLRGGAVVHGDVVAGLRQMACHRIAHDAEAEECEFRCRPCVLQSEWRKRAHRRRRSAHVVSAASPSRRYRVAPRRSRRAPGRARCRPRDRGFATEPSSVSTSNTSSSISGENCRRSASGSAARSQPRVSACAHRARDGFVRIAKRNALAHEVVGKVGRRRVSLRAPLRACARRSASVPVATRSVMIASESASVSTVSNSGSLSSWLSLLYASGCPFISTSSAIR